MVITVSPGDDFGGLLFLQQTYALYLTDTACYWKEIMAEAYHVPLGCAEGSQAASKHLCSHWVHCSIMTVDHELNFIICSPFLTGELAWLLINAWFRIHTICGSTPYSEWRLSWAGNSYDLCGNMYPLSGWELPNLHIPWFCLGQGYLTLSLFSQVLVEVAHSILHSNILFRIKSAILGEENTPRVRRRSGWGKAERGRNRYKRWLYCTFIDCNWCELTSPAFYNMLL